MYAHYMQKNVSDCGIAVVRTILDQLEINVQSVKGLYRNYKLSKAQGISLADIDEILKQYGVQSSSYEVEDFEELKKVSTFPYLLVVSQEGYAHYIVVHAFHKGRFVISNPAEISIQHYDEQRLKSIFLGYALCIDAIETKFRAPSKVKEEGLKEKIYHSVLRETSFYCKVQMILLLILKYALPLAMTIMIQNSMYQNSSNVIYIFDFRDFTAIVFLRNEN